MKDAGGLEMQVLIVDDASLVRMSLKDILDKSEYDFEFLEAVNGREAVNMYKKNQPDFVIMDITMPEMDGITAVGEIKKIDEDAKIIMCTSMAYEEKVIDAVSAGASDYIVKPYEPSKVIDAVKKIMD
ncbi:MAG: response regulator [Lachnospiraceae bacterium]|nr:response regulator [Lachnospiraceae bacterium]